MMDDEDEMVNFPSCWVGGSVGRCVGTAIGDKLYGVYENRKMHQELAGVPSSF